MPGFLVGAGVAVMAGGDAMAADLAEASIVPSLHNGLLECGVALFQFAHVVAIWCVVGDGIAARVIGTTLGFELLQERLNHSILHGLICHKLL